MRKINICFLTILFLVLVGERAAGVIKVGTTGAQFLKVGVGSRAVAMGGAFVAVADDATTLYWNPAGLSRLSKNGVVLIHSEWLADIDFDFAGVTIPLGEYGTLGASLTALNMAEMEVRTMEKPEGTGEKFDAGDFAVGLSYAYNLTDRFSIGFNGKYIRQKIWLMSAFSFAVDVGTLFYTQLPGLSIGMSISNFGSKLRMEGDNTLRFYDEDPSIEGNNDRVPVHLDTDRWPLPLLFRVGVAYQALKGRSSSLILAMDALHPNDNTERVNVGFEYGWNDMVFIRGGYKSMFALDSEEGLTGGGGLKFALSRLVTLYLDYAYADFGRLLNTQRFSLRLEF